MQCPIEYVAIPAIIALGATLGRKIAVRPKQFDNWTCVTNFWGMVIGPPGVLKSPAMEEVLKPMRRLEAEARRNFAAEMELYKAALERWEDEKTEARKNDRPTPEKPVEPTAKRYLSSDTTYEKLGVILGENPNGILVFRDELISLLLDLDKEEKCNARSFFMSAWNGDSGYTFDRIIRGTCHIEHACVSLMGAATPSRISRYIANVEKTGMGGDGLIQRFGFMIWPDIRPEWTNVDKAPNRDAREAAFAAFDRLDKIAMNDVGAELEPYDDTPFLRFSPDADRLFVQWREPLEMQLRAGGSTPMLDAHFSKYRKLVPALALVNHLSNPRGGGTYSRGGASFSPAVCGIFGESCPPHLCIGRSWGHRRSSPRHPRENPQGRSSRRVQAARNSTKGLGEIRLARPGASGARSALRAWLDCRRMARPRARRRAPK